MKGLLLVALLLLVNNDWSNWFVLHGNSKVVNDDVCNIGKMVGLKFKGDKNNMFDVLSGGGRRNSESGGKGFRPTSVVEG